MFTYIDRQIKRLIRWLDTFWAPTQTSAPEEKPKILGLLPHERPGFTLTSVPFYPVPLTPAELEAMGKAEERIGVKLSCACRKQRRRKRK